MKCCVILYLGIILRFDVTRRNIIAFIRYTCVKMILDRYFDVKTFIVTDFVSKSYSIGNLRSISSIMTDFSVRDALSQFHWFVDILARFLTIFLIEPSCGDLTSFWVTLTPFIDLPTLWKHFWRYFEFRCDVQIWRQQIPWQFEHLNLFSVKI